jgi:hypothetical protein
MLILIACLVLGRTGTAVDGAPQLGIHRWLGGVYDSADRKYPEARAQQQTRISTHAIASIGPFLVQWLKRLNFALSSKFALIVSLLTDCIGTVSIK